MINAPVSGELRLLTANKYVANKNDKRAAQIAYQAKTNCTCWQEAWQFKPTAVKEMANFRHLNAADFGGFEDQRDAADCLTSVHKSHTVKHFSVTEVCQGFNDSKVAKNRTPHIIAFNVGKPKWNKPVGVINVHLNWVQGVASGQVVDEYVESCRALNDMIKFVKGMNWIPFVLGDINITRKEAATRKHLTPYEILKDNGLTVVDNHLDIIAYYPNNVKLTGKHIIGQKLTGADHDWLVGDFKIV